MNRSTRLALIAVIVTLIDLYAWYFVRGNQPYDTLDDLTWCHSRYRAAKTAGDTAGASGDEGESGNRTSARLTAGTYTTIVCSPVLVLRRGRCSRTELMSPGIAAGSGAPRCLLGPAVRVWSLA